MGEYPESAHDRSFHLGKVATFQFNRSDFAVLLMTTQNCCKSLIFLAWMSSALVSSAATFVVSNENDSGTGSFRQALQAAQFPELAT